VYVDADLSTCEERDPKGLYKRARRGEIDDFTGISAPYEPPNLPELTVDTMQYSIEECIDILSEYVSKKFAMAN
jgi:adenylylsulfate kinase-like enzyme